jgi:hypothetical protein
MGIPYCSNVLLLYFDVLFCSVLYYHMCTASLKYHQSMSMMYSMRRESDSDKRKRSISYRILFLIISYYFLLFLIFSYYFIPSHVDLPYRVVSYHFIACRIAWCYIFFSLLWTARPSVCLSVCLSLSSSFSVDLTLYEPPLQCSVSAVSVSVSELVSV